MCPILTGVAVPLVGLTTVQAFEDKGLSEGQRVLVLGASGGTGYMAVQVAKAKGSCVYHRHQHIQVQHHRYTLHIC